MFTKTGKKAIGKANVLIAALLASGLGAAHVGCLQASSAPPGERSGTASGAGGAADLGTVGVALTLSGGLVVDSVTYDLLDSTGSPVALAAQSNPGTIDVTNSNAINFQLGGVPVGAADSITLTAPIVGGGVCQGSASGITIVAGATTAVSVHAICSLPGPDAGNLTVTGTTSNCGTWTGLATAGSETRVGGTVVLTATATGPNTSNLGYTWTTSNPIGVFGSQPDGGVGTPAVNEAVGPSDSISFLCTAAGTTTVTVVVDDGPLATGAPACPSSLTTISTTVVCDP